MMHWLAKYIGLPHAPGGRGPFAFDCWGILCLVYANEYGIVLPDLPGITSQPVRALVGAFQREMMQDWAPSSRPFDGCAVAMSQQNAIHHVGIYAEADRGKVVHCWESQCVIADDFTAIRLKGFRTVKFYRHRLWPT